MEDALALVSVTDLADRLPFVMDTDELREAEGAVEDLSDDARDMGNPNWSTPEKAPREVKRLILRAAGRHMKNYDGFIRSQAGDESLSWTDRGEQAGSAYFTERELRTLRRLGGNRTVGFYSVGTYAYSNDVAVRDERDQLVPADEGDPIHYFASGSDPW